MPKPAPPSELQRWNDRFGKPGFLFGTSPNAFLASQRDLLKRGHQALAVADGEGRNGVWLAQHGLAVVSVDFSPVALGKARALAAERGVTIETIEADLGAWDWPVAEFDLVVAIFIQFAPPDMRARMFEGMIRTLKPGGLLILQGYRPEQVDYATGGPPMRENMYTPELLRAAFVELTIMRLESYDSEIAEGTAHAGMSALIELVARKPTERPPAVR